MKSYHVFTIKLNKLFIPGTAVSFKVNVTLADLESTPLIRVVLGQRD